MRLHLPLAALLVLLLSTAQTCNKRISADATSYVSWVEDPENGLLAAKKNGTLKFELQFTPLEYRILKEHAEDTLTPASLKNYTAEIKDMQYFTFRISDDRGGDLLKADAASKEDFSSRLQYFSSGMQKDLSLIEGADTLPCLLFHFERAYGIDPRSTFVLGFPLGKKDGPGGVPCTAGKTLLFNDHQLGSGPLYIEIRPENIQQLPYLNLD